MAGEPPCDGLSGEEAVETPLGRRDGGEVTQDVRGGPGGPGVQGTFDVLCVGGLVRRRCLLRLGRPALPGANFCSPQFTVSELREVCETVWGVELDRPNFHRKVTDVAYARPVTGARSGPGGVQGELGDGLGGGLR